MARELPFLVQQSKYHTYHEQRVRPAIRHGPNNGFGMVFPDLVEHIEDLGIQMAFGTVMAFHFPSGRNGPHDIVMNGRLGPSVINYYS
jgi:hypothetical protein